MKCYTLAFLFKHIRLLGFKRVALNQSMDEFGDSEFFPFGRMDHTASKFFVRESKRPTQSVFNEVFGEAASKIFFTIENEFA